MKELAYKNYILEQIIKSDIEDSLLVFANELIQLKDHKNLNLFWDNDEEDQIRSYIDRLNRTSRN